MKFSARFSGALAALALVFLTARPVRALPNVHLVAQAVDQHYNRLRSLEAEFSEIYQGGGLQRTESGTLRLKKPGKMRWDYRSPEEKLFVSNGTDAWLYLPQEKQARRSSLKQLEDLRSPLAFLLGKTRLEKELQNLSFAPDVQVWQPGSSMLRGVPRGMEDRVEHTYWAMQDLDIPKTRLHEGQRLQWFSQHEIIELPENQIGFGFKEIVLDFFRQQPWKKHR